MTIAVMTSSVGVPHRRYTLTAMALHWLLALAIVCTFSVGVYMTDLPFSPGRIKLFNWHKWAGVSILLLSALRLLWRLRYAPPALPQGMPAWQVRASHLSHAALYVLFFAVPLAGWAYSSAAGFPLVWFGVLALPDWVPVDGELAALLKLTHLSFAYGLAALVLLHLAAVAKHHWIDRDGLLGRMLPSRPSV